MNNKKTILDIILKIVLILIALLVIYWLVQLILGGSPSLNEFNFGLIILIAGLLIKMYRELGETKVEIKHISKGIKEGFNKIREDINYININTGLIKKRLK